MRLCKCRECRKELKQKPHQSNRHFGQIRYCNDVCKEREAHLRAVDAVGKRYCQNEKCGNEIIRKYGMAISAFASEKFCCFACCEAQRLAESRKPKPCVFCGELFYPSEGQYPSEFNRVKYCGDACRSAARSSRGRVKPQEVKHERAVTPEPRVVLVIPDKPEFYAPPPPRLEGAPECSVEGCCDTANPWTGKCSRHSISRPSFDDVDLFEERTMVACV